jgi:hypothetical protein
VHAARVVVDGVGTEDDFAGLDGFGDPDGFAGDGFGDPDGFAGDGFGDPDGFAGDGFASDGLGSGFRSGLGDGLGLVPSISTISRAIWRLT